MFFAPKEASPKRGFERMAAAFYNQLFQGLDSADWLCEGINRGSKPRFTEKRADPRRM
jgi:hypothetical protein